MKYSWVVRLIGVIVLVIGIAAVAYFAYTAGAEQALTADAVAPAVEAGAAWHTPWVGHPLHGLAFLPFLLCLAPFFLGLFIFLPIRMIFGPHRMYMHRRWHGWACGEEVPPPVAEWHRRMHEEKKDDS